MQHVPSAVVKSLLEKSQFRVCERLRARIMRAEPDVPKIVHRKKRGYEEARRKEQQRGIPHREACARALLQFSLTWPKSPSL